MVLDLISKDFLAERDELDPLKLEINFEGNKWTPAEDSPYNGDPEYPQAHHHQELLDLDNQGLLGRIEIDENL